MPITFEGCYTAVVTPLNAKGTELDLERFTEQIEFQAKGGVSGIVPCGTTGESPTLSDREWERVIAHAVEVGHRHGLAVIAGTGSNHTAHAVELQKRASDLGADAGLSVNPYYNKPTQEGLYRHFLAVADAAALPVILYNIPGRAGVALDADTIERLAHHDRIAAVKEATGSIDSASAILAQCDITILSGDDTMTLPFGSIGGRGVISVIANLLPDRVREMCDAFLTNDWPLARRRHFELLALARGLLALATNPIPVKTAMKLLDRDTGAMRLPMCEPSAEVEASIRARLTEAGLL